MIRYPPLRRGVALSVEDGPRPSKRRVVATDEPCVRRGTGGEMITADLLRENGACEDHVKKFEAWMKERGWEGCRPTLRNCGEAEKRGLDLRWLASSGLMPLEVALTDPEWAYAYALYIDKAPRDDTRAAACGDPYWAYRYARDVDRTPRDDTRAAACGGPEWAHRYARFVDEAPRDDTRAAACGEPGWAYKYARFVDEAPRDDTRAAACEEPRWAYLYALYVDKAPREDTREAVKGSPWEDNYREWEENR